MVSEFMISEGRNFTAFAMLKACQAFQGLQLDESDEQPEEQPVHHLTPEAAAENVRLAQEYRSESRCPGGLVVVFKGEVCGWVNELRDPHHWEPGVVAIDEDCNQFQAFGGDPQNGATSWQPVWTSQFLKGGAA
jgi:hypothetical protein